MAKVVIQLINDAGDLEKESTLIEGVTAEAAEQFFSEVAREAEVLAGPDLVVEFHYTDGDVGAYDDLAVQKLWAHFAKRDTASHIVVRRDSEEGQLLSNQLFAAAKMAAGLRASVSPR